MAVTSGHSARDDVEARQPLQWSTIDCRGARATARVAAPPGLRLDRRHLVMQAAFGRTNSTLGEFRVRDIGWSVADRGFGFGGGPFFGPALRCRAGK
ncbi:MAG: plasmid pRiA4b ORF-3 family protein [Alphaproteobacteria bacterium]|nr:plasmid pRiA4b ORF-3 family protein [Alphaproteobacteria bacterium]